MVRREMLGTVLAIIALLALVVPALAGGWTVVTLDGLPPDPPAGKPLKLGFMVRQHGITPIDDGYGEPLKPYLTAHNRDTGETIRFDARKAGPVGHFVVDVTFPSGGTWELEITPPPFEGTKLGTLTVLPAAAKAEQAPATGLWAIELATLRWGGVLLLLVAAGLALFDQRNVFSRRRALRTR